jgi:FdhD protein
VYKLVTERRRIQVIDLGPARSVGGVIDELALDEPVRIFVNGEYLATLIATPEMRRELAAGYLLSEGVIDSVEDIASIETRDNDVMIHTSREMDLREATTNMMNLIATTGSASPRPRASPNIPKVESSMRVRADDLKKMMTRLNRVSSVHMRTRGTHAAMLCSVNGETLAFAEDVGRHNALDKVIGAYMLRGGDTRSCVLLSTGRQSEEMVQKAGRARVPMVSSLAVPLISGVRLAEAAGITLASLSTGKLKVYTCPERIIV